MRRQIGVGTLLALTSCIVGVGCRDIEDGTGEAASVSVDANSSLPTSETSVARVNDIRSRFQAHGPDAKVMTDQAFRNTLARAVGGAPIPLQPRPVIAPTVVKRFAQSPGALSATHVRAEMPADQLAGHKHVAQVDLPRNATGSVIVEDSASHVRVGFALKNAKNAEAKQAGGYAIYPGAADGADVVHRVHAEGTEDFIVFEKKPAVTSLSYDVDVANVAGLRLVSNTLEFLDTDGSPALRVDAPYVIDANGKPHGATLTVDGCAYDTNAAAPWGRDLVKPGANRCTVSVAWGDVSYPALVDPSWTTTGSLQPRWMQTASLLASGKVLISGGYNTVTWDIHNSAEIYNPSTGTFAATGSLANNLLGHAQTLLANGTTLVTGGDPWYGMGSAPLNIAQIFNESTGTFSSISSMSAGRRFHTGTLLGNGKVLVAGGRIFGWGPEGELFDPATNTFSNANTPALGSDEGTHTATLLASGKVLLTSGENTSGKVYDPANGSYANTGAQNGGIRADAGSIRLSSGKVLIFGGYNPSSGAYLNKGQVYDPATNAFTATGTLPQTGAAEAALLPSGQALLVGYGNATLLYNPSTNNFSAGLSTIYTRYNPTVTRLNNNKVLVAGGDSWGGEPYSTAELYNP
jgi:hypothetical protein